MGINWFMCSGVISSYGCKITRTDSGNLQTSLTLVCKEPGREEATVKTLIPVRIVGTQAETLAETLDPGDAILLEGKLTYRTGKMKASGKLVVTCLAVERLTPATVAVSAD